MQKQIQLTTLLGITMKITWDGQLVLTAPFTGNTNHIGSAFAGSLGSIATLAGWARISLLPCKRGVTANVLIQDSSIQYLRPVLSDFEASPEMLRKGNLDNFLETLRRKGRSPVQVNVRIRDADGSAVTFSGRYIAFI